MNAKLTTAHFQLTGRCNLSCRFCGQNKGMLACGEAEELSLETWKRVAEELKEAAAPEQALVTLWGGEPLLYSHVDELAQYLFASGIEVQIVTNGTLIHEHADVLSRFFAKIHISVDGLRDVHDAVRNPGTFDAIRRNLPLLQNRRGKVIFLTTVSDANVDGIHELPYRLYEELHPDEIVLQPLMYLSSREISEYRKIMKKTFGCDYPEIEGWCREDATEYQEKLAKELVLVEKQEYPLPVVFTPHGANPEKHCFRPYSFAHIRHDGEVGFCTDYFGFSAGNVKKTPLNEIFYSERARAYRKAVEDDIMATCRHCPWRLQ